MKFNFSRKIKIVFSVILIIISIGLLSNTNNNPTALIERIFKPIAIGRGTLYYAVIFPILLIYFAFKYINKFGEFKLLKTRSRRILATILVLLFSNQLITDGIKITKSRFTDLNSIYYNRSNVLNNLSFNYDNQSNEVITSTIDLENCSEKAQEFYIKVLLPKNYKEFIEQKVLLPKESSFISDEKYILHPKEKKVIHAKFFGDLKESNTSFTTGFNEFEFSLLNDKEEVKFTIKQ